MRTPGNGSRTTTFLMVATGETTGEVPQALSYLADRYEDETRVALGASVVRGALTFTLWAFLLACGVLARVRQYLFTHSYWYDEAFLVVPVRERGFADLLGPQPFNLVSPPGFLWVERALYLAFGHSRRTDEAEDERELATVGEGAYGSGVL